MANRILVVGVGNYPDPADHLPGVANDVREMANLLTSDKGIFDRNGMCVLTDAQATKAAIERELDTALARAGRDDTVLIYFAGHGTLDGTSAYFVPHDGDGVDLAASCIALADVKRRFDATPSRRVILMFDSCYSGGVIPRRFGGVDGISRALEFIAGEGRIILAACTETQLAWEDSATGHGRFTHALLRGLKGAAERDGEITVSGLFDFIDREIGGVKQRPMMYGRQVGRVVLLHTQPRSGAPSQSAPSSGAPTSAKLILLGSLYVSAKKVSENGQRFSIECTTASSRDDVAMRQLQSKIPFAYRTSAGVATVRERRSEIDGDGQAVWHLELDVRSARDGSGEAGTTGYSAAQLAQLRASRLLTGSPPAQPGGPMVTGSLVESMIQGLGQPYVTQSIFAELMPTLRADPERLAKIRLAALYRLQATQCVDETIELSFVETTKGTVHVRFQGARRAGMAGPGTMLEVEGDCAI